MSNLVVILSLVVFGFTCILDDRQSEIEESEVKNEMKSDRSEPKVDLVKQICLGNK